MTKRKINLSLILALMLIITANAQTQQEEKKETWVDKGSIYGVIFANFHTDIAHSESDRGFEVKRAYLGYKVKIDPNFSANIKLDIGSPDDVSEYSLSKRFAYFKNAYLQYKISDLTLQFGIADSKQFKAQEKFWGYRYIYKSYMDEYKFGPSADLGLFANYKLNDAIEIDASFSNGEGYNALQTDEDFNAAFGISYKPIKIISLRVYYDSYIANQTNQSNLVGFVGINFKPLSLGAEYNYQMNNKSIENQDMYGYSIYATYKASNKIKLFARYDQVFSNKLEGEINPWNLENDGSSIITGIEYSPAKQVNLALNYQDRLAYADNGTDEHFLFINIKVSF
jgi:hypothetical protein